MNSTTADVTTDTDSPVVLQLGADLSPAVKALETAYRMIQRRFPDVPNATIVVKRDARAWGHTTVNKVWSPAKAESADRLEIMVSGENLARGAESVAGTLIHEAAHAKNLANGVLDCNVNGRHNMKFKKAAEGLGLTVEEMGWHGFAKTHLNEEQAAAWKQVVSTIDKGLQKSAKAAAPAPVVIPTGAAGAAGPAGTIVPPRKRGDRNLIKASCPGCGSSIRASRGVLTGCKPTCTMCDEEFTWA